MKILALRADSGGCAKYRIIEPARVVKEQFGVDIRIESGADVDASKDTRTKMVKVHEIREDVDLIIIQRPVDNAMLSLIQQAKRQGIATVVELDDDLANVHPQNLSYRYLSPRHSPHSNYEWAQRAALEADLVTVSSLKLSRYAPHQRYEVIRNCVPESIFDIDPPRIDRPVIGWTGTVQTHPSDLFVVNGGVHAAMVNTDAAFHVVGDGEGVQSSLQIPTTADFTKSGWVPLEDYYREIAQNINIGIVPLELSTFNTSKSYLKGLEFAALGIPFVASPTYEYKLLSVSGIGEIAKSSGDWSRHLSRWIKYPDTRNRVAEKFREHVRASHTYEANAHRWMNAWERAVDLSR